jgi:proteasome lid subunit RPN8/RPN11
MSFSIARITRRLLAPQHELSCSVWLWRRLKVALRERGRNATRESGAFLLGERDGPRVHIVDFVLYDDLDPRSLDSGIVHFNGENFGALWALCRARNLEVVADIHVHPGGEGQSLSDQAHPMISSAGHIALILPGYAREPVPTERVGIYRYEGNKRWISVRGGDRRKFFHIGL